MADGALGFVFPLHRSGGRIHGEEQYGLGAQIGELVARADVVRGVFDGAKEQAIFKSEVTPVAVRGIGSDGRGEFAHEFAGGQVDAQAARTAFHIHGVAADAERSAGIADADIVMNAVEVDEQVLHVELPQLAPIVSIEAAETMHAAGDHVALRNERRGALPMTVRDLELDIAEPKHRELALHDFVIRAERVRGAAVLMSPASSAGWGGGFFELQTVAMTNESAVGPAQTFHLLLNRWRDLFRRDDEIGELLGIVRGIERTDLHGHASAVEACTGIPMPRGLGEGFIRLHGDDLQIGLARQSEREVGVTRFEHHGITFFDFRGIEDGFRLRHHGGIERLFFGDGCGNGQWSRVAIKEIDDAFVRGGDDAAIARREAEHATLDFLLPPFRALAVVVDGADLAVVADHGLAAGDDEFEHFFFERHEFVLHQRAGFGGDTFAVDLFHFLPAINRQRAALRAHHAPRSRHRRAHAKL